MPLDPLEFFKIAFAILGGAVVVYQAIAVFTSKLPLRQVVNPDRRSFLLVGIGLMSMGYSTLAIIAGNKWMPAEIWTVAAPLFNEEKTPLKVVATIFICFVLGGLLVGASLFCWRIYPRDPRSFVPHAQNSQARRDAIDRALYHYTTRRGGLEYAAFIVLAPEKKPAVEELILGLPTKCGSYLLESLHRRDSLVNDDENEKQRASRADLKVRASNWLSFAIAAEAALWNLGEKYANSTGMITHAFTGWERGGMLFEYLFELNPDEHNFLLIGATSSQEQVVNGRLEMHYKMLKEAISYIVKKKSDLVQIRTSSSEAQAVVSVQTPAVTG